MDPGDSWQQPKTNIEVSGSKSTNQTPKDSSNANQNEKTSGGRRSSESGPPPFNRNRSFKTKQLVRSQAIRESQSPPRIPSPRSLRMPDSRDVRLQMTGKIKSASVDLDDRPTCDSAPSRANFPTAVCETIQKNVASDANSFKSTNISSKNILVSASDIKKLGANVIYSTERLESNTVIDDKQISTPETMEDSQQDKQVCVERNESSNNNDNLKCNKNIAPKSPSFEEPSSVDIDYSRVIDYSHGDGLEAKEADVDCHSVSLQATQSNSTKFIQNTKRNEKIDAENKQIFQPDPGRGSEPVKNKRVTLKNLKNIEIENATKIEFQPVAIQVTSGEGAQQEIAINRFKSSNPITEGRRAVHPSKQDSGVSCWDSCNCCGDTSPEIMMSDTEDDNRSKHLAGCPEQVHQYPNTDNSRCTEKSTNSQSSMLTVQRSNSGGNQRLLRKQSSGGSIDSGQHSTSSPFLSRDNSTEYMGPCEVLDINGFIKDTLNKTSKDRSSILKLEIELIAFMKDPSRREHKFPAYSSYARLLVHRCAQLFGLRHGPDPVTRSLVHVAKLPQVVSSYRLPSLCPLQQWCTTIFPPEITTATTETPPAKSILKRDTQSLDEEPSALTSAPPKLIQTPRSKSFEQREEEYVRARRRIFNSPKQVSAERPWFWDGTLYNETESELYHTRILMAPDHGKSGRLLKVQSLEHENIPVINRGVVSKAHSFGGYGGRQSVQRGDSITTTNNTPSHRILSRQGELASNSWRLSPCSSGYKTLSARSDSITPSPTSTPYTPNSANVNKNTLSPGNVNVSNDNTNMGGVLWAITDMSTVPPGAVIIHPSSGQALTNSDGSLYHYDPGKPLHSALLPCTQTPTENIRVLTNPERRRSRLEKQRATISPGTESDNSSGETKVSAAAVSDDLKCNDQLGDLKNTDEKNTNTSELDNETVKNTNEEPPLSSDTSVTKDTAPNPDYVQSESSSRNYNTTSKSNLPVHNTEQVQQQIREEECSRMFMNMSVNSGGINVDNLTDQTQNYMESPTSKQLVYYEQREGIAEMENKCNMEPRQMENYVMAYPEIHGQGYYAQTNASQYYGPIYDESNSEMYAAQGYGIRSNEALLPAPHHQIPPPQIVYAAPPESAISYAPPSELCYPTPVLMQQPHYRLQESDQPPQSYNFITSPDQQQPMMIALNNKLHEPDMTPQIASYPITYPPHMERPPVISSSPAIVAAPHPALGYQIPGASGWSYWPQVAVYTHPQPTPDDGSQKYQPQHGGYITQAPELNPTNIPTIPQTFYPHSNIIQPNQYYPAYQPAQIIQQPYQVYQQYNPGRTSVVSQEGCSTPGFQMYDVNSSSNIHNATFVQDFQKANVRSPKGTISRNASNPGSSRGTPLTNIPMHSEFNYPNVDPNFNTNYQFIQPPVNYAPYPFPHQVENNFQGNYTEYPSQTKNENEFSKVKNPSPKTFIKSSEKKNISYPETKPEENEQPKNIIILQNTGDKKNDKKILLTKSIVKTDNIPTSIIEIDTSQKPPPIPQSIIKQNNESDVDAQANKTCSTKKNIYSNENRPHPKNAQRNPAPNAIHKNSFPSWNIRENDFQRNDNYNHMQVSLMKQVSLVGNPPDVRMPWRKNTGYNQREFHNFPKNLNRQKYSNAQDTDRVHPQNRNKEKFSNFHNANQRGKSQPLFDTPPIQITPTSLNAPPVPWNLQGPSLTNICNNANAKNANQVSSYLSNSINQTNLLDRRASESPLNNQHALGKGRMSPLDVCMAAAAQQRYMDAITIPIAQTSIYQRNPAFNNGGLGLIQTPPLQGQSTFLLRQVPGWLRRPPAPALFGPPPSVPGQVRGKPPRHHHPHGRNFYH